MVPHKKNKGDGKVDVKINDHESEEETPDGKIVISNINDLKSAKIVDNNNVSLNEDKEDEPKELKTNENYKLPPLSLLDPPKKVKNNNQAGIEANIKKLEEVLREFGIIGHVVEVTVGPAITQYELELKAGN